MRYNIIKVKELTKTKERKDSMLNRRQKKKDPWLTQPRATVISAIIALIAVILQLLFK